MKTDGKILYIKPKSSKMFRLTRNNWNYYQTLFFASVSFNVLLFILLVCKNI